jgi:uncharacterized protein (DUF2236 family)
MMRSLSLTSPTDQPSRPMAWRLHQEVVLLAGWGRAILLQLAHPLVAQGVADHSGFRAERWGRLHRLDRTLQAMLALTFGSDQEAETAAKGIRAIHRRVHGELPSAEGPFPAHARYTAEDPALLTWVHATLLDSYLLTYELLVGPLTAQEQDRYCAESRRAESLLGMPPGCLPASVVELRAYLAHMLASGEIAVGDTARRLAQDILYPPTFLIGRPLVALARLPAVGLLPSAVRRGYGLAWSRRQDRALAVVAAVSRRLLPFIPPALRYWPAARAARQLAQRDGHWRKAG